MKSIPKSFKIVYIISLIVALIAVRLFERSLFPEVLLDFYTTTYSFSEPPNFNWFNLISTTILRYLVNSVLSILIIYLLFPSTKTLKFIIWFYCLALVVLISVFSILLYQLKPEDYMTLFYVRRFLIQPLFLILLVPALYYQKKVAHK
ncbi:exosortase F system-associated membrane protein [Psychroflexus sp. ALD_RP9]|uniref:exosortase F system-associated membrane protein n=1 Tax=Psychroflexus sp. ALD_RP9 TaxID=2777186 RepID=UPI001A90B857|nr:exosortase F system-associated protein [Psychroflexus sp. ALD_RP9]